MTERDRSIDLLKGTLVIGMIYAHIMSFFSHLPYFAIIVKLFINVITFSGFLFCFGYVCQLSYFHKTINTVYKKLLNNFFKMIVAFYISAIFYRFLTTDNFGLNNILNIIFLFDIPTLSEFLIAFALINLVTIPLFGTFKSIIKNKIMFWIIISLLLLTTFFPYELVTTKQIGLLIGTTKFYAFPILQYMPFYLLGMYFAAYKINYNIYIFIGSIFSSLIYILYIIIYHDNPVRFPPSIFFILAPMFYLYMFYLFFKVLIQKKVSISLLELMGKNVLYYLLFSNILIFIFKLRIIKLNLDLNIINSLLVLIIVLGLITYFILISTKNNIKNEETK